MASRLECHVQSIIDAISQSHQSGILYNGSGRNGETARSKRFVCFVILLLVSKSHSVHSRRLSAGSGIMSSLQDPPPPVAADAAWHELQAQLAVENVCVASSQLLEMIRTLRLSLLLMDEDAIVAEEEYQVLTEKQVAQEAQKQADELEAEWRKLRNAI
jgi:hypothetical protein